MRAIILLFLFCFLNKLTLLSQCTFTSSVPYFESFSTIPADNQVPNCWSASNLGTSSLTFTNNPNAFSGQRCAAFHHIPGGTNYFYSNGIQLFAGVIYSTSIFYKTDNAGGNNWSSISLSLTTSQSATLGTGITSTNNPNTATYLPLSSTFSVSASGIYFLCITGSGSTGLSEKLFFDNISITIPCSGLGAANSPTIVLSTNNGFTTSIGSTSICASAQNTLVALGANTYTWAGGSNSPSIITNASIPNALSVVGTNTLTGCSASKSIAQVYTIPNITITANTQTICPGESVTLSAVGANTYSWSNGSTSISTTFSPLTSGTFSVLGTFTNTGCQNASTFFITVAPAAVTASASSATICSGSNLTLFAAGTASFQWSGPGLASTSASVSVAPTTNSTFTVLGSNSPACTATATIAITVSPAPTIAVTAPSKICSGESIIASASGAVSYQWLGNNLISASSNATLSPTSTNVYTIVGTGQNSCVANFTFTVTTSQCLSIDESPALQFSAFPNPFTDKISLNNYDNATSISLLDMSGHSVFAAAAGITSINTSELPVGIYILKIEYPSKTVYSKLLKSSQP